MKEHLRLFTMTTNHRVGKTSCGKNGSMTIHHRNIQSLSIEMYKIYHGSDQSILGDMISVRKDNTLRADFYVPAVRTEKYGKNSVRYLGPLNTIKMQITC